MAFLQTLGHFGLVFAILATILLDDSALAQTKIWDGGAGTLSWHDANNWSPHGVPGPSDDVLIDLPDVTITVMHTTGTSTINSLVCRENLTLSGGTLDIAAASEIAGTLSLNDRATLTGGGNVTVTAFGAIDWAGGTMSGTGTTIIAARAMLDITANNAKTLERTLDVHGLFQWSVGGALNCSDGVINIGPGGSYESQFASQFNSSGGTNAFNNAGTANVGTGAFNIPLNNSGSFTKNAPGTATVSGFFNNSGTTNIHGGTLSIANGGIHTGPFVLANGSTLTLNGSHGFSAAATITGTGTLTCGTSGTRAFNGNVTFTGNGTFRGSNIFIGAFGLTGSMSILGGTTTISSTFTPTSVSISDATLNVNADQTWGTVSLSSSGTMAGSGDVTVTGTLTWNGGTMSGAGRTIVTESATASIGTTTGKTLSRQLENHGTCTWSGGTINHNGGTWDNMPGAVLTITAPNGANLNQLTGFSIFNNHGIVHKSSTGTTTIGIHVNNTGAITSNAGTLSLANNGIHAGTFTLTGGATLAFNGMHLFSASSMISGEGNLSCGSADAGMCTFNGDVSITGNGVFQGTNVFNGTFNCIGTVTVSGGSTTINNTFTPTSVTISNGTLAVSTDQTWTNLNLSGTGGTLASDGDVIITSTMTWSGGTMQGEGRTIVNSGATLSLSDSARYLRRTLMNNGTIHHVGSGLFFHDGTFINNGQYNVTANGMMLIEAQGGTNSFINTGTINKGGSGTMRVMASGGSLIFNNTGTVNCGAGMIDLQVDATHTGEILLSSGIGGAVTLILNGTHTFTPEAIISGIGNLTCGSTGTRTFNNNVFLVGNATLQGTNVFSGMASCTGDVIVSGGLTTISQPMPVGDEVRITNGGVLHTSVDQEWQVIHLAGATSALEGRGNLTIAGTMTWGSGVMRGEGQTIIVPGATLNMNGGIPPKTLSRTLVNNGTINYTQGNLLFSGGTLINNTLCVINISSSNTYSVQASGGSNLFVNTGTVTKNGTGIAIFNVAAGSLVYDSIGTTNLNAGTLHLSSGVAQYSNNILAGGTWNVAANSSLTFSAASSIRTLGSGTSVRLQGTASNFATMNPLTTINPGASFELAGGRDFAASPVGGTLTNSGRLILGPDSDLVITGAYAQSADGELHLDYNAARGPAITATSTIALNGALDLDFLNGYTLAFGSNMTLLSTSGGAVSGMFSVESLPPIDSGSPLTHMALVYGPTAVALSNGYRPGAFIGSSGDTWFDSDNWGSGSLPDSNTDVLLNVQLLIDQAGALARNLNILNGGELIVGNPSGIGTLAVSQTLTVETGGTLTLIANGHVSAATLTVHMGATLNIGPGSSLAVTNLDMQPGSTLHWTGGTITITSGTWTNPVGATIEIGCDGHPAALIVVNSAVVIADAISICSLGEVRGHGTFAGNVTNSGTVRPGLSAGALSITGHYNQTIDGTLVIEVGGLTPITQHDQLLIDGTAALNGRLVVDLINGFAPAANDMTTFLTASACTGNVQLLDIESAAGVYGDLVQTATSLAYAAIGLPHVPGQTSHQYASITSGQTLAFAPDRTLYVGRDNNLLPPPVSIARVSPGGSPVTLFGNPLFDPDAVIVDVAGAFAPVPGSILAAGVANLSDHGVVHAIAPNGSTTIIFGPSTQLSDTACLNIDGMGRLLMTMLGTQEVLVSTGAANFPTQLINLDAQPVHTAVDQADRIYTSSTDGVIRVHDAAGELVNNAFVSGLNSSVGLAYPASGSVWGNRLYVVNRFTGELLQVTPGGSVSVVGSGFEQFHFAAFGPDDALYVMRSNVIVRIAPPGGIDRDGDGIPDDFDNCPDHANPSQADCDFDGHGDVCEIASGTSTDVNANGIPDDCEAFIPGDINGDGTVGPADLGILLGSWGNPGCAGSMPCAADLNGDGTVGPADLGILLGNWG